MSYSTLSQNIFRITLWRESIDSNEAVLLSKFFRSILICGTISRFPNYLKHTLQYSILENVYNMLDFGAADDSLNFEAQKDLETLREGMWMGPSTDTTGRFHDPQEKLRKGGLFFSELLLDIFLWKKNILFLLSIELRIWGSAHLLQWWLKLVWQTNKRFTGEFSIWNLSDLCDYYVLCYELVVPPRPPPFAEYHSLII